MQPGNATAQRSVSSWKTIVLHDHGVDATTQTPLLTFREVATQVPEVPVKNPPPLKTIQAPPQTRAGAGIYKSPPSALMTHSVGQGGLKGPPPIPSNGQGPVQKGGDAPPSTADSFAFFASPDAKSSEAQGERNPNDVFLQLDRICSIKINSNSQNIIIITN